MILVYTLDGTDRYEIEISDECAKALRIFFKPEHFSIGKTNNE